MGLSPRMVENARRLHPHCRFSVASVTDLDLGEATLGGVLGWGDRNDSWA
ncbi:class I SAM-dependent methyltransferase [Streptomyces rimosus]|nr:hypothetical protein [Streptomyces rimosus]